MPDAFFCIINPAFEQPRCRDIAMPLTNVMRLTQESCQLIGPHFL